MGLWRQIAFILRKNFYIKRRNKKETLQEILIPAYWLLILLAIKLGVKTTEDPAVKTSEIPRFDIFQLDSLFRQGGIVKPQTNTTVKPIVGFVVENEPRAQEVVKLLEQYSNNSVEYRPFDSSENMVKFYKSNGTKLPFAGGIIFDKDKEHGGIAYTLRVPVDNIPGVKTKLTTLDKCHNKKAFLSPFSCPANDYILYRTATMQAAIDAAISKIVANLSYHVVPNITAQMMPKDAFKPTLDALSTTVPIYMVLAFAPYITILVINLVSEKTEKQKELMRIMGMLDTAYWLSWFLTYAIVVLVASIIMTVIAVPAGLLGGSNYALMLIIFFLYGLSLITLSFMMSPLFKNPKTAGFIASLFTIVFGILVIPLTGPSIPNSAKWVVSLLSPTAFAFALNEAVDLNPGLQFSNLATKGDFPASNAIIMLIVDTLLYLLLALYLDAVVPAEYGKRQPPYFIFQPSFWKGLFCGSSVDEKGVRRQMSAREIYNCEDVEPVAQEMIGREAISIHKLRKVFPGKEETVAVDGISMDIYEGQVTALLGHNGAGKTTLLAALTGMVTPTSGTALIYGKDITSFADVADIRRNIGVCPQQDVIFQFLTVKEHLQFYAGLKDLPGSKINDHVNAIIKEIGLEDKRDDIAKNLSGGQKRKLCVGIALVGNPKVLFLDEPTSGMDPYSRRSMWSVIQQRAKDRCVLLTTHFMDEADILADYKAIMSKGKIRCAGTSLFLKNRFGIGYHLNTALSPDCDTDRLTTFVQQHVPGADVIRHHGYEMAFSLPLEEVTSFSGLFVGFEDNNGGELGCAAKDLGVTSYGVSMTTLEEVFLQLEDTNEDESTESSQENNTQGTHIPEALAVDNGAMLMSGSQTSGINNGTVTLNVPEMDDGSTRQGSWYSQQAAGLLKIRWLNTIRSPLKVLFQIIIPPILVIVGLVLLKDRKVEAPEDTIQLPLAPSYCLRSASTESYASALLFENSTEQSMRKVLGFLEDYKVKVDQVKSVEGYLNSSSASQRCLGIDVEQFPTATNMSAVNVTDLFSKYVLRYNDTTVHSIPVGINLLSSLYNMYVLATQNMSHYPIKTFLQPLPSLKPKWTYDASFVALLLIGIGFGMVPGGFGIECVAYRQTRVRHLLRVSGVSTIMFWFHMFIADFIVYLIPAILVLILIPAMQVPSLIPAAAMGCLVITALLYLPAMILLAYCISFLFSNWESSQQVLPTILNILGLVPFVPVAMVDMLGSPDTAIMMHYVFSCLDPCYGLFGALYYINRIFLYAAVQAQSNDVTIEASQYFTWTKYNGIPVVFIALTVHVVLLSLLLYYLDSRNTGSVGKCPCTASKRKVDLGRMTSFQSDEPIDDDVKEEKERLLSNEFGGQGASTDYAVTVKGLWKKFGHGKKSKVVVKDMYFGVQPGEVFGLLGPNGAGKSTTLNMMTAEVPASRGNVTVAGYDIRTNAYEVFQHLGFCPQTDALFPDITLEEHLTLYARVRGVPWGNIKSVVNHYMAAMKITEHAKKRSKALSGGTKRKLSFGMAMMGDPDLLLLDEPSTGMDPSARRFLWNTISKNVTGNRGAILTTHSMEEADALCSRVGIMVKGELKCLGSTQHLKGKFGSGYSLEIKLDSTHHALQEGEDSQAKLIEFVEKLFPSATRTESFGDRVIYKVPKDNVSKLSVTFSALEEGKRTVGIEEYSFSQSTLEQVFLEFAREQDDDRTGAKDQETEGRPLSASSNHEVPQV